LNLNPITGSHCFLQ